MEGFKKTYPVVMPGESLVPSRYLISPAPNQFTHALARSQRYAFDESNHAPAGELPEGAKVVLMVHDGGSRCRVVDDQGRYVEVDYDSLKKL
jgi:hypothetical protein